MQDLCSQPQKKGISRYFLNTHISICSFKKKKLKNPILDRQKISMELQIHPNILGPAVPTLPSQRALLSAECVCKTHKKILEQDIHPKAFDKEQGLVERKGLLKQLFSVCVFFFFLSFFPLEFIHPLMTSLALQPVWALSSKINVSVQTLFNTLLKGKDCVCKNKQTNKKSNKTDLLRRHLLSTSRGYQFLL